MSDPKLLDAADELVVLLDPLHPTEADTRSAREVIPALAAEVRRLTDENARFRRVSQRSEETVRSG